MRLAIPSKRYAIPGHAWIPSAEAKAKGVDVIRIEGKSALVRTTEDPRFPLAMLPPPNRPPAEIAQWSEENEAKEIEAAEAMLGNLLNRSSTSDKATQCLWYQAKAILRLFADRAAGKDETAFRAMLDLATLATEALNQTARKHSSLAVKHAKRRIQWPVIGSVAPYLKDDCEDLFGVIQLGKATGLQYDQHSKTKADMAHQIALGLLARVRLLAEVRATKQSIQPLPDFSKDTFNDWWKIAETEFLETYPKPESVAELANLIPVNSKRQYPDILGIWWLQPSSKGRSL